MNDLDFNKIMLRYEHELTKKYNIPINEKSLLSTLKSSLEWLGYTDEEKHTYHKVVLSVAKKTNNFKGFEYEILLIEIYDLLVSLVDAFIDHHENDAVFRLLSIVAICKYYKSEYRDLAQTNIYPFKVLSEHIKSNEVYDSLISAKPELEELRLKIDSLLELNQVLSQVSLQQKR